MFNPPLAGPKPLFWQPLRQLMPGGVPKRLFGVRQELTRHSIRATAAKAG